MKRIAHCYLFEERNVGINNIPLICIYILQIKYCIFTQTYAVYILQYIHPSKGFLGSKKSLDPRSKIKYPKSIKIHFSKSFKRKPSQTCSTGTLYTPRFPFFQGRKLTTKWVPKSLLQNAKKKCSFCGTVEIENVRLRVTTKWVKKINMHLKASLEKIFVTLC